jgi:hypothetical protein
MCHVCPDAREAERLGDRCDHRHCAIRGDGQHSVHTDSARDLHDGLGVREVDDLGNVGGDEAGRVAVTVDRCDAQAARARPLDRAALMSSRADKEDRCHGRRW